MCAAVTGSNVDAVRAVVIEETVSRDRGARQYALSEQSVVIWYWQSW